MGAWFRWLRRIYTSLISSDSIRQIVLPAAAASTVVTENAVANTYGDWADVALAADVLQETLITGVSITGISAAGVFTLDIGSCAGYANAAAVIAAGAPAIAAAHRQSIRVEYLEVTAVGISIGGYYKQDSPIHIPSGVGILARVMSVAGGVKTVDVAVECKQGF